MVLRTIILAGALLAPPVFSQMVLWDEDTSTPPTEIPPFFENTISSIPISLDTAGILALASGDNATVTLETGMVKTVVIDTINLFDGVVQIIGRLVDEPNSLIEIQFDGTTLTGSVQLNLEEVGYRLQITSADSGVLLKQELGEFVCEGIPLQPNYLEEPEKSSNLSLLAQPLSTVSSVPLYSSSPEATRVFYLDFDGETIVNTPWNSVHNGGAPIVATPFDADGNPSTFNDLEQTYIRNAWERTKEAYSIYQVNVTTDKNVFNATPISRRQRMMITPTRAWYPNDAGGVAHSRSFGTGDPAWGFSYSYASSRAGANMGLIAIHEIGHTLDLRHDDLYGAPYHRGQLGWGPFMGAPYKSSYATFSNGDYPGATQHQSDLIVISGYVPFRPDAVGKNNSNSDSGTTNAEVESRIEAFGDTDVYQFQAEKGQKINAYVTALGEYPTVNTLSILYDQGGVELARSDKLPTSPEPFPAADSLGSEISHVAKQAGTYYLHVKGNGYNGGADYSHSAYGAVGRYRVLVTADNITLVPIIMMLLDDEDEPPM